MSLKQAKWHARTEAAQSLALQSVKQGSKSRCKARQQTAAGVRWHRGILA